MTRTLNGCPACASTRGHWRLLYGWYCEDCRRAVGDPAAIEVPRSITEMIADTEASESAERKRGNGP